VALLLTLLIFLFSSHSSYASEEFTVDQTIEYQIKDNGQASVTHNFSITNLYSQIYLKEYEISLDLANPTQITGHDSNGNIIKSISTQDSLTKIHLQFAKPKIGKDQITQFSINYLINQFAVHKGKTWEIQLPVFTLIKNESLNLKLDIPSSFGQLSFSSFKNPQIQITNDRQILTLSLDNNSKNNKILLIYGNNQLFNFDLNYYLSNPNSYSITTEIAVPPDTNTQKINFDNFTPKPDFIKRDPDGNWLAQYTLLPNQNIAVTVRGSAKVFSVLKTPEIIEPTRYLEAKQYWPTDSPIISNVIQNFKTPKDIYNFTVSYLNYNFDNLQSATRQGALEALKTPNNALCTEFSDLFVTLARAKNIPAREIEGFAYTNNPKIKPLNSNSDILHAWPQFYDTSSQTWISVDPTWEKTTNGIDYFSDLDLNHLVFVIHGIDSIYPPPPGSYRGPQNQKTVNVEFATNSPKNIYNPLTVYLENQKLVVINPNLTSINNLYLSVNSKTFTINQLPPLGKTSFDLKTLPFIPTKISYQSDEISNVISTKATIKPTTSLILIAGAITFLCLIGIIITSIHNQHEKSS
jgi:hypothetical protein